LTCDRFQKGGLTNTVAPDNGDPRASLHEQVYSSRKRAIVPDTDTLDGEDVTTGRRRFGQFEVHDLLVNARLDFTLEGSQPLDLLRFGLGLTGLGGLGSKSFDETLELLALTG
jgi:hypothetical protein